MYQIRNYYYIYIIASKWVYGTLIEFILKIFKTLLNGVICNDMQLLEYYLMK